MVKNSNDLLGLIIKMADSDGDVDANELVKASGLDYVSVDYLASELVDKRYIIKTLDTISVTQFGKNNYKPLYKRIAEHLLNVILRIIGIIICIAIAVAIARNG